MIENISFMLFSLDRVYKQKYLISVRIGMWEYENMRFCVYDECLKCFNVVLLILFKFVSGFFTGTGRLN